MLYRQVGRLDRLEQRVGTRCCVAHQINIITRNAATGHEDGEGTLCDRCGRPARPHVIKFEVVPDRTKE